MFITGPQVIKAVTGEDVTFETLGGADVHNSISGVAHFKVQMKRNVLSDIKRLISFLPDNNLSDVHSYTASNDDLNRIS